MALSRTQTELRTDVRRTGDWEGTSSLTRHPDTSVNDAIDRGRAALDRMLREVMPDERALSSTTANTTAGTSLYALPATFRSLLSVDITANGTKYWLEPYEMPERALLTSANTQWNGIPFSYRLRAGNIEFLPIPGGTYSYTLWYVPDSTQGNNSLDTIERLDDFVIWYAARELATKERLWDLCDRMTQRLGEIKSDIYVLARNRDMNGMPRVKDVRPVDRYGRIR